MDPLTSLLLAVASIVIGAALPWFLYRKSRNDARSEAALTRGIIQNLMALQSATAPAAAGIAPGVGGGGWHATAVQAPVTMLEPAPDTAITQLVLASLSVLQDERGQVDMRRLLAEIGAAVGPELVSAAENALRELRRRGAVEWQGDDRDLTRIAKLNVRM